MNTIRIENTHEYYNAKPSNISNLGLDVSGAKRMHFNTYETLEERESRKQKTSNEKSHREAFKTAIFAENPDKNLIKLLISEKFKKDYNFDATADNARFIITERRKSLPTPCTRGEAREFNKMINSFNSLKKDFIDIDSDYYFSKWLEKARKRYSSKNSFVEQSGQKFSWKKFQESDKGNLELAIIYLKDYSKAVQFGNSVSDKERAYIIKELCNFIQAFKLGITSKIDIEQVSWSFGARGKTTSVAYYLASKKLISVNKDNIGSLIHEIGHYIDDVSNNISRKMSYKTICEYEKTLPDLMSRKEKMYYCSKHEIFARAFEAYCFRYASFSQFAQCGKSYLPELNQELIDLIESALKIKQL